MLLSTWALYLWCLVKIGTSSFLGPKDYHTKWSKPDRERQISYIVFMWNLKNKDTNELKTEIDPQT